MDGLVVSRTRIHRLGALAYVALLVISIAATGLPSSPVLAAGALLLATAIAWTVLRWGFRPCIAIDAESVRWWPLADRARRIPARDVRAWGLGGKRLWLSWGDADEWVELTGAAASDRSRLEATLRELAGAPRFDHRPR